MADYNAFSMIELREMLLNGELEHEYLTEEDYSDLIDNEMSLPEPLNEVIEYCIGGLDKFDGYKELENINIDIHALIKQVENEKQMKRRRNLKKIPAVAAAAVVVVMLSQSVSMAFGFDLLGYIFKWDKEILHIESPPNGSADKEPIYAEYEKIENIPADIKDYIPSYIWKNYEFYNASQLIHGDVFIINYYFNDIINEDTGLLITINKSQNQSVEKDDEYFEEYEKDGVVYTIFKNLEYYKVVWVDGDLLYHVNVNLPLDEVKNIVDMFSQIP